MCVLFIVFLCFELIYVLIYSGGKNIMLDCGMHMGFNDDRKFPDFSYIVQGKSLSKMKV